MLNKFQQLQQHCGSVGLNNGELVEALLWHSVQFAKQPFVMEVLNSKLDSIEAMACPENEVLSACLAVERYLAHFPGEMLSIVEEMAKAGALDEPRAQANWLKVELLLTHLDSESTGIIYNPNATIQ